MAPAAGAARAARDNRRTLRPIGAAVALATERDLEDFLRGVEKRAFKRTVYAVRDENAALDIVQDAMMRLAERYADRPVEEFAPLFQRILANATMDWFRRRRVRDGVLQNLSDFEAPGDGGEFDPLEHLAALQDAAGGSEGTDTAVSRRQVLEAIEDEVARLPGRQREAFLLRYWEEFDVAETAAAMGCTEGSVKTHCSRAVRSLAQALRRRGITP
jgi:RNA polymerase sigma-70 factor (ECF subfamily)